MNSSSPAASPVFTLLGPVVRRLVAAASLIAGPRALHGQATGPLQANEIIVSDHNLSPSGVGGLVRVNTTTGAQTIVTQGGNFGDLFGVAYETANSAIVGDGGSGRVFRVNITTGAQTQIAAGLGRTTGGIAVDVDGTIYGVMENFGLFKISATGQTTTLALSGAPGSVCVHPNGQLYVAANNVSNSQPGIARVDRITGQMTAVSAGGLITAYGAIAVDINGDLLLADGGSSAQTDNKIIRINVTTGAQTLLTTAVNARGPRAIWVDPAGTIFVGDYGDNASDGIAGLFKLDRATGVLTPFSIGMHFRNLVAIAGPPMVLTTPPAIVTQPVSQAVTAGSAATLAVVATGLPAPTFQWRKDGTPLVGATNAAHLISAVLGGDLGTYDVLVTNSVGTVSSQPASVFLVPPPMAGNQVLNLNGTISAVHLPAAALNNLGAGTIEAWVYLRSNAGVILAKQRDQVNTYTVLSLGWMTDGATDGAVPLVANQVYFHPRNGTRASISTGSIGLAMWHHVAVAFTDSLARIFIDGVLDTTTAGNFSVADDLAATLTAGAFFSSGRVSNALDGQMDNLRIWNRALTEAEVRASMGASLAGNETGLLLQFSFNGGNTNDSTANARHGTLQGGAAVVPAPAAGVPAITLQPTSRLIAVGAGATLGVTATGAMPLNYQWRRAGVVIAGATGASLPFASAQLTDAGGYDVVVTNAVGSVTSATATLNVGASPLASGLVGHWPLDGDASDLSTFANHGTIRGNVAFSAGRVGQAGVFDAPGAKYVEVAHQPQYVFGDSFAISFWFRPAVAMAYGRVLQKHFPTQDPGNSWEVRLEAGQMVFANPLLAGVSTRSGIGVGAWRHLAFVYSRSDQKLSAYLDGQWEATETVALGNLNTTLSLLFMLDRQNSALSENGQLDEVRLYNRALSSDEVQFLFTLDDQPVAPAITTQPVAQTAAVGGSAIFTVVATGTPAPTYQWRKGTTNIAGATTATLTLANVQPAAAGSYDVVVTNSAGSATSHAATLTVSSTLATTLAIASTSLTVGVAAPAFTPVTAAGGTTPYSFALAPALPGGLTLNAATGAIAGTPATVSAATTYTLTVTDAAGATSSKAFSLVVAAASLAPVIVAQPASQALSAGATLTLSVGATGTAPLSYQWKKGGIALAGATTATIMIATVGLSDAGDYTVVVTNAAGIVTSSVATVAVLPAGFAAAHAVVGPGYQAGGTVTIANTLNYSGTLSALGWEVLLPDGWSFAATDSGDVRPGAGATSVLDWAWFSTIPASGSTFTYTLNVPAGATGTQSLVALMLPRQTGVEFRLLAKPDPLPVPKITFHSADTMGATPGTPPDNRLNLSELLRVIELYNHRAGTVRTGQYTMQAGTEDGFVPGPGGTPLTIYHSADTMGASPGTPRDGKLNLSELLRVIELYNYRAGTVRTGQYHLQSGTEDGFAPGP